MLMHLSGQENYPNYKIQFLVRVFGTVKASNPYIRMQTHV